MGKSLKITESQLKRLLKFTINEQHQYKSNPPKEGFKMMDIVNEQLDPTQQLGKWVMQGGEWIWKNILNPDVSGGKPKQTPTQTTPTQTTPTQTTPTQTTPTQTTPQDNKSITLQIQNALTKLNYFYAKPTGFYGPKTKEAVKDWQLANQGKGLKSDGYFIKGRDDKALGVDMGSVPRLYYQPPVQKTTPIQKTVPTRNSGNEYNDAAMRGINNTNQRTLKTPQVSQRQPSPDTISTDHRNRQGNY